MVEDDLPSVDSHSSDDEEWNSDLDKDEELSDSAPPSEDSDEEMDYELAPRNHPVEKSKDAGVQRLPIKLANGHIQETGRIITQKVEESESESESEAEEIPAPRIREDVATGARFGRAAVVDVVATKSRKLRIQLAKDQIAELCQSIVSDPENSVRSILPSHMYSSN